MSYSIDISVLRYSLFHYGQLNDGDNVPPQKQWSPAPLRKDSAKQKSMISEVHRSVPPFRVGLCAHQIQDAIPVIVLKEIQFARPVGELVPIKQNSEWLRAAYTILSYQQCSMLNYYHWQSTVVTQCIILTAEGNLHFSYQSDSNAAALTFCKTVVALYFRNKDLKYPQKYEKCTYTHTCKTIPHPTHLSTHTTSSIYKFWAMHRPMTKFKSL